jgi:protein tyrosine phosphatase (PTP) superfamily phosphohydrolase (DUF442 family)
MRPTSRAAFALVLAVVSFGRGPAGAASSGEGSVALAGRLIPRFQQVDARLFRGGQPDRQGLEALRALGVRTVVNLRSEHDERLLVEQAGLKYVYIPVDPSPFGLTTRFPESAMREAFKAIDDPVGGPVFVHCRRGADRTGVVIAAYRILRQRWTAEAAYGEARTVGMRWWYRGFRAQLFELAPPGAGRTSAWLPIRQAG